METILHTESHNSIEFLVERIRTTSDMLRHNALSVINKDVTTRAWLTGFYIVEYEQNGEDRAKYGEGLIKELSKRLKDKSFSISYLKVYRSFYLSFPGLGYAVVEYVKSNIGKSQTLSGFFPAIQNFSKSQTPSGLLMEAPADTKNQTLSDFFNQAENVAELSTDGFAMLTTEGKVMPVPEIIFNRLSFSHISLLLPIKDDMARAFYAIEAMRGPWSVRELKRQIDSNYYIRSGWSNKPQLLANRLVGKIEKPTLREEIKSPYTFEFLGLQSRDVWEESDLEQSLMDHLQEFIMELGMGFCLEARQKKLLIDDRYYKADLVFYHRILKCHCIIECKARRLDYSDMSQLNMYIEYYRKHYMQPDDNPPVGLLLCTEYGQEMVEYLAPFTDPNLFVAKYELQLPDKNKVKEFLMNENRTNRP